jgi:hypothetical protein
MGAAHPQTGCSRPQTVCVAVVQASYRDSFPDPGSLQHVVPLMVLKARCICADAAAATPIAAFCCSC